MAPRPLSGRRDGGSRGPHISLFWRLFIPNACVLTTACVVLIIEPANGYIPALVGGLTALLVANALIIRRTFGPLGRLTALMKQVDPLEPGQRIPPMGPESEVSDLAREFNAMLDRLETERRESARRAAASQDAEHRHVAAELHDEIGQTLTALVLQTDRLRKQAPPDRAELDEAGATARAALEDVRRLARRLRPEALDELGLGPALTSLCDRLSQRTGLLIHRSLPGARLPLSADARLAVYRVAQEGLTNVVRHARAREARIELTQRDGYVELTVVDDGIGYGGPGPGSDGGVRSMRERAVLIGGHVSWSRVPSGGTAVHLRVPVAEVER